LPLLIDLSATLVRIPRLNEADRTLDRSFICNPKINEDAKGSKQFVIRFIRRIELIRDSVVRSTIFDIDGCKFVVSDFVSLWALSPYVEHFVYELFFSMLSAGDIFIDVGAHIGKYTISLGKILKRGLVIALKLHPLNFHFLKKNVELNGLSNAVLLNVAAFSCDCLLPLYLGKSSSTHSLMKRFTESTSIIPVRAVRLDALIQDVSLSKNVELSRIRFVKIDVKGAELEVLKGMQIILGEIRPLLIIEVRKENLKEFLNIMDAHSYECKELIDKHTKGAKDTSCVNRINANSREY